MVFAKDCDSVCSERKWKEEEGWQVSEIWGHRKILPVLQVWFRLAMVWNFTDQCPFLECGGCFQEDISVVLTKALTWRITSQSTLPRWLCIAVLFGYQNCLFFPLTYLCSCLVGFLLMCVKTHNVCEFLDLYQLEERKKKEVNEYCSQMERKINARHPLEPTATKELQWCFL